MTRKIISCFLTEEFIPTNMPPGTILNDTTIYYNDTNLLYIQTEPEAIYMLESFLVKHYKRYKYIFTFSDNILKKCPNAIFYIYGTTWIPKEIYTSIDIYKKKFKISSLTGGKNFTIGHQFRKTLYDLQLELSDIFTWFISKHSPVPSIQDNNVIDSKFELFETFQFSIVIENSQQINYFTEKLIDCLITKTIPIYWGCPNISTFFNTTGWILLDSTDIESFKSKINTLTSDYYMNYISIIEENYTKAIEYCDLKRNLERACASIKPHHDIRKIRWLRNNIN